MLLAVLLLLVFSGIDGGSVARAADWKFGDQLKGREKELYEILEENYPVLQNYKKVNGINVKFRSPMTQKEAESMGWFRPFQAFLLDYSDLFWISTLNAAGTTEFDPVTGIYSTSDIVVYMVDRYQGIRGEIKSAQVRLSEAIAEVKKCSGRYAKVKAAHDYVIKLATYPDNVMPDYYHAVTGPLLSKYAHQGVCEAYAWLFDIICKANGIPCVILTGNNHAWNYVQMEDGRWYLVDTTWDDPDNGGVIYYDYFLVGAETNARAGKVRYTHNPNSTREIYRINGVAPLNYPTLSSQAYQKGSSPAQKDKKVTSVKLRASTKKVKAGKKLVLKAIVSPNDAAIKKLKWSSSNTKYATVTQKGVVKTKKAGKGKTVKITAKATDGSGKKATIKIRIR